MKYGESIFDILYLLTAILSGCLILRKKHDAAGILMGSAVLVLGAGDAFHLVPRVLNYFVDADFTFQLGLGKLITSLTMTVFYVLLYLLHQQLFRSPRGSSLKLFVFAAAIVRAMLCLLPQNGWFTNESSLLLGTVRNIPFAALGAMIIFLYRTTRRQSNELRRIWLYVTLSFLFYIPVAVFAPLLPTLGMLMLPKTVCYILMIIAFLRFIRNGSRIQRNYN